MEHRYIGASAPNNCSSALVAVAARLRVLAVVFAMCREVRPARVCVCIIHAAIRSFHSTALSRGLIHSPVQRSPYYIARQLGN